MVEILAINGGPKVIEPDAARFNWPRITANTEQVVLKQLHEDLSIYDNSGIFGSFEAKFAKYHNRKYSLLSNSGTSSILAMFEAIKLEAGDEVLCPVYTFHASVSPMMYLGVIPVFCDADSMGNISINEIKKRKTDKTKAVVVTHMWGNPVQDIEAIAEYCETEGIFLLEDCSHAHGAEINGKRVGSFGDIAAWSLQGKKIITGGEGGILLTDKLDLYNRALLHGHYNKRPQKEIDESDPMREFYLTGFGLKLRAHPIAVAIADQQFDQLDNFLAMKRKYIDKLNYAFSKYPFLKTPKSSDVYKPSWYAYGMRFISDEAFSVSKEDFIKALLAEGLVEVDVPGSTGLLHTLPLFTHPERVLGRLYKSSIEQQKGFDGAQSFYDDFFKLPVWAFEEDSSVVDAYIHGIVKVSDYLVTHKSLR
jgi:dTDP-4-amino-4,6-dideoxygalactose transaminase